MKPFFCLLLCITALLLSSCYHSENEKLILGNWSGSEWLVNGAPSGFNAEETHFNFNDKGEYVFQYAESTEKGTYKVENDMLFTTPAGQHEIMVKILKVTKDSLVFEMNRGGRPETLTLLHK